MCFMKDDIGDVSYSLLLVMAKHFTDMPFMDVQSTTLAVELLTGMQMKRWMGQ